MRDATLHSAGLGRDVSLRGAPPPVLRGGREDYPVVYALHGLFESSQFWERRGLAPILDELWARHVLPEFVVVAVDGGNSFFLNSPQGAYEDLVTKDAIAYAESTYRVRRERSGRALLRRVHGRVRRAAHRAEPSGTLRGGGDAQRDAARRTAAAGTGRGSVSARGLRARVRRASRPRPVEGERSARTGREGDRGPAPALSFDCGDHDRYGLGAGNEELHRRLQARGIAHEFALHPGDHGYEYVRSVLPSSLEFCRRGSARSKYKPAV